MIDKIELNDLIRQLDCKRTKLNSHGTWYIGGKLKEYYKSGDQKVLAKLMRLCRLCLYKIKNGADYKVWEEVYDYMYETSHILYKKKEK